jgi:hypothetical protein
MVRLDSPTLAMAATVYASTAERMPIDSYLLPARPDASISSEIIETTVLSLSAFITRRLLPAAWIALNWCEMAGHSFRGSATERQIRICTTSLIMHGRKNSRVGKYRKLLRSLHNSSSSDMPLEVTASSYIMAENHCFVIIQEESNNF